MIRTRFAPSPTGFLHIGGARTALFSHLHARHHQGTTLLRIEDTDVERSSQEAVDAILDGLRWLGLDADEGPFYQTHNAAQHLATAHHLLAQGKAYRCYCSKEEVEQMREIQRERNEKPRYDGRCRHRLDQPDTQEYVIRFKTPQDGEVVWEDLIQGSIRFQNKELDDLVLVRTNGTTTYNLAVVSDDHFMDITQVIRGEDHISNTPRQIHLFQAMGWTVPEYGHMPLLHGTDGAKLSKRHGAVSVLQYREEGYLPQAVLNYLVRLGWSHGEQEIFSMEEMIRYFDIHQVGRSAAIFNRSKLDWLNGHYLRHSTPAQLAPELGYHLGKMGFANIPLEVLQTVLPCVQERAKTLKEMAEKLRFFFVEQVEPYNPVAVRKHFQAEVIGAFQQLLQELDQLEEWTEQNIEGIFKNVIASHGLPMAKLAQPVRIALTGTDVSPGVYEILKLLGRTTGLSRLDRGLVLLEQAVCQRTEESA